MLWPCLLLVLTSISVDPFTIGKCCFSQNEDELKLLLMCIENMISQPSSPFVYKSVVSKIESLRSPCSLMQ